MLGLNLEDVRVDRVTTGLQNIWHDPLGFCIVVGCHLSQKFAVRQIVAGQADPHPQLPRLDLDQGFDFPVVVIRVVKVTTGGKNFFLHPFVLFIRSDLVRVLQVSPRLANEHSKLIRPDIDPAGGINRPGGNGQ